MKKIYLLLLVALIVTACQKDPLGGSGTLRITAEGMHGAGKVAVSGTVSYWASDDQVLINGEQVTVNIDEPNNTVTVNYASSFEAPFFGVYPAGIYVSNSGADYTLNLPSTYTYATTTHYGRTLQNLPSPMVAYLATAGDNPVLEFKHVTGALNVMVINHYGFTIQVDSIVVSSNKYQLCGSKTVALGNTITVNAVDTNDEALRRVKLVGGTALRVLAGDTAIIQVPVLPVGPDNRFTVEVGVYKVDQPAVKKVFSKTQGNAGSNYSLGRAQIGYVPTKFGGLFTINARGKKVIISQGNLQYIGSAATPYWQFATRQYDFLGDNGQATAGENKNRDLFCWATSGWNNGNYLYYPYSLPASYAKEKGYGFGPTDGSNYKYSLVGVYDSADWGVYNKIRNGGNESGRWRTLSGEESGEWYYMLTSRILSYKYVQATVNEVKGLILFPDDYMHPNGISFTNLNTLNSYYALNVFTEEQWVILEAAGAVFFPLAGLRSGTASTYSANQAYYWTSSASSVAQHAFCIWLGPNSNSLRKNEKRYSYSVRLVHDVN